MRNATHRRTARKGKLGMGEAQMKRSKSFVAQRRKTIAQILRDRKRVSVAELSDRLSISPLTVRRALDYLEERGVLTRRYGEALLAEDSQAAPSASRRERAHEAIAREAAKLVRERDSVFVNTSTTALGVIPHIDAEGVTVITNSARAMGSNIPPTMTVLLTGGEVRAPRSVMGGEFALNNIRMVSPQRCILGCAGITADTGITSLTLQEATVNSLMIERSDQHVLLMDSSKFGVEAGFRYASAADIDLLITDMDAPADALDAMRRGGVGEIVVVDPDE